jgi:hypothetical protein
MDMNFTPSISSWVVFCTSLDNTKWIISSPVSNSARVVIVIFFILSLLGELAF